MKYITTEETKTLKARMIHLGYLYAKHAMTGDQDAKEAYWTVQSIVDELENDLRYNSRMAATNYQSMMAVMDVIRDQERDENGRYELPYTLANALHALLYM